MIAALPVDLHPELLSIYFVAPRVLFSLTQLAFLCSSYEALKLRALSASCRSFSSFFFGARARLVASFRRSSVSQVTLVPRKATALRRYAPYLFVLATRKREVPVGIYSWLAVLVDLSIPPTIGTNK